MELYFSDRHICGDDIHICIGGPDWAVLIDGCADPSLTSFRNLLNPNSVPHFLQRGRWKMKRHF